jgi:histidyl-tRNA synthetase
MSPESECLRLVEEVLSELDIGKFETRVGSEDNYAMFTTQPPILQINHKLLLDGVFALSGILPEDVKTVSSSIDKLDKIVGSIRARPACSDIN